MNRLMRMAIAVVGVFTLVAATAACDTTDDSYYQYAGTTGIAGYPDLQFFKDAGAPLVHLEILCNFGGTLQWRQSVERAASDMVQGQSLVQYCGNFVVNGYRGTLSTSWFISGRQS
jgi:hypothetical protein